MSALGDSLKPNTSPASTISQAFTKGVGHKRTPSTSSGGSSNTPPSASPVGTITTAELERLREKFKGKDGVPLKNKVVHMRAYKNIFTGKDAIDWVVKSANCKREEAIAILQVWMQAGDFNSLLEEGSFDENTIFEFKNKEAVALAQQSSPLPRSGTRKDFSTMNLFNVMSPININTADDIKKLVKCQACVRRWTAKNVFKRLRLAHQRRNEISQEVLVTEKSYISRLKTLIEVFMKPLRSSIATDANAPIISEMQFKIIFSEIDVIVFYNSVFLQDLEKRLRDWNPVHSRLGDVFLISADFVQVYVRYVKNFMNAVFTLKSLMMDSRVFAHFVNSRKQLPQCAKLDLEDFLVMPIQRISQYQLWIEELINHSFMDEKEFKKLVKAREKILEVINVKLETIGPETFTKIMERAQAEIEAEKANAEITVSKKRGLSVIPSRRRSEKITRGSDDKDKTVDKTLVQKDQDLWGILTLVLNALETNEDKILKVIENSLQEPPRHLKTIQIMNKIMKRSKTFLELNKKEASIIKIQTLFRGRRARKAYQELGVKYGRHLSIRNNTFRDFYNSERIYVEQLNSTVTHFLLPLRDMMRKKGISISPGDIAGLFSNIETIFEIHEQLLFHMETQYTRWPRLDTMGELFTKVISLFNPYPEYIRNFKCAGDTLLRCQQENEKFVAFLHEVASQTNRKYELYKLLAAPLHRIDHYKSFLENFLKYTLESHPDYKNLQIAITKIQELSKRIEKAESNAENYASLYDVRRRLDMTDYKLLEVFEGKRKFVKEGAASVIEGKNKEKRYLFLFNDLILITKANTKTKSFIYLKMINFTSSTTADAGVDTSSKYSIKLKTDVETQFLFKSSLERDEWLNLLKKVFVSNEKKRQTKEKKMKEKEQKKSTQKKSEKSTSSLHQRKESEASSGSEKSEYSHDSTGESKRELSETERSKDDLSVSFESSKTDSVGGEKLSFSGVLLKMKEKRKSNRYLTWGPTSELDQPSSPQESMMVASSSSASATPSGPSNEETYFQSLRKMIESGEDDEDSEGSIKPIRSAAFKKPLPKIESDDEPAPQDKKVEQQEIEKIVLSSPGKRKDSKKIITAQQPTSSEGNQKFLKRSSSNTKV